MKKYEITQADIDAYHAGVAKQLMDRAMEEVDDAMGCMKPEVRLVYLNRRLDGLKTTVIKAFSDKLPISVLSMISELTADGLQARICKVQEQLHTQSH